MLTNKFIIFITLSPHKYISILMLILSSSIYAQEKIIIHSPDGKAQSEIMLADGKLSWTMNYNNKPVLLSSALGIGRFSDGLRLKEVIRSKKDTVWNPVLGERNSIRDNYNQLNIRLIKSTGDCLYCFDREIDLEVRAYNEGVAFRYNLMEILKQGADESDIVVNEMTEFTLPENTKAWFTDYAQSLYQLLPLSNWPDECERPLTLELPNGLYACLSEAALVDFARTKFVVSDKKANTIACKLFGPVENVISFSSPWRVVMAAEQPGQLLENNFIMLNLNQPSAIKDVSWIKPGKIMWDLTNSTKGSKAAIDYAVKRKMQYVHIDAGWYGFEGGDNSDATKVAADSVGYATNGNLDIEEVVKYGKERGIGVWLYVNQKHLARQLDDILPLYKKWGIKGIKFGFVQVGSQYWTTWLHQAIRKCAKYEMLVDIHDEYRPTGYSRTYPNLVSAEGILSEMTPDATHDTHLAFTRFIAGPADFTLAYYGTTGTTFAHRLSLPIVFFNPIPPLYCYDGTDKYQGEPEIELWDNLPTTWDDTKVLQGGIGKFITVARRSGSEWFIGAITNSESRSIKIPLSFLDNNATYTAYIYSDGGPEIKTATHVKVEQRAVKSNQTLSFDLKATGGVSVRIVKK